MKLGISTYTYGWAVGISPKEYPLVGLNEQVLLDKTKHHGLHLLQIGDNLPLHTMGEGQMGLFKAKAMELGVQIEVGAKMLTEEILYLYLKLAAKLDSNLL